VFLPLAGLFLFHPVLPEGKAPPTEGIHFSKGVSGFRQKPSALVNSTPFPQADSKPSHDVIDVPQGAKLPAALMDVGSEEDSPQVREMLASLGDEFFDDLNSTTSSGIPLEDAWEKARTASDERYRALLGQDAYLQVLSLAAEDAASDEGG